MTAMLGSVRGAQDARALLAQRVDIVDLLDAEPEAAAEVAAHKAGARLWASLGRRDPGDGADRAAALTAAGADCVKAPAPAAGAALDPVARLLRAVGAGRLVVALPADRIGDRALLEALAQAGVAGVMLDPAGADDRALLERASLAELRRFVDACRALGLQSGLSGALEPPDVPRLLALAPDIIGFGRALLGADPRRASPDPQAVARLRGLIPGAADAAPARDTRTDRVFVRDLVADMRIGVYARERGVRQPVRFTVEVDVARPGGGRAEFRDVFSYDLITDRIRMMAESEHHDLVEGVAEAIADAVLAHPRAMRVMVRVEKLAVVAGAVGVEIVRSRR